MKTFTNIIKQTLALGLAFIFSTALSVEVIAQDGIIATQTRITAKPKPTPNPFASIEYADINLDELLKPKVVILLDSSGSMGQLLDKQKSKMFYAKKLFRSYMQQQWREKADVGLLVYGGRRKKDCEDYFMSIPVGERSLAKIERSVSRLAPIGMTPIASSLELAIQKLKDYPGPKRVMIFTDGEETCGGDSCKILEKAIQEKVLDLEMFVTGIGMKEDSKDLDNLRCLGKTFGGESPAALNQSLNDMNAMSNPQQTGGGNNLYVECPDPNADVAVFRLEKDGTRKFVRTFRASYGAKFPPGEYSAEVLLEPTFVFKHFKIPPKKKVTLKVKGQGQVRVNFFEGLLDVEVIDRNKKVVDSFVSDQTELVKTGVYDIRISADPFFEKLEKNYKIVPAGNHEFNIDGVGVVQIDYPGNVGIHIYNDADKLVGNYITNFPFVIKTGTYRFFVNDQCNIKNIAVRNQKVIQRLGCIQE